MLGLGREGGSCEFLSVYGGAHCGECAQCRCVMFIYHDTLKSEVVAVDVRGDRRGRREMAHLPRLGSLLAAMVAAPTIAVNSPSASPGSREEVGDG